MKKDIAVFALLTVGSGGLAQDAARSVWDGVYTQEQADRGKASYANECAACHGVDLSGGDIPPALTGGQFLDNYQTVGSLFDRIRTTMPLNEKAGKLSREVNADILAFILQANDFPAGSTLLATRSEVLNNIKIDAKK